jgi:dihydropteroate synthase
MLELAAARGSGYVLMHMLGTPRDMQADPRYERDVVREVLAFLRERASACAAAGIAPEKLVVDPGIGFGKRLEHNLALLARGRELGSLGLSLMFGPSRKSFIADLERRMVRDGAAAPPRERIGGTAAAVTLAVQAGADILRVHDVRAMAQASRVAYACSDARLDAPIA